MLIDWFTVAAQVVNFLILVVLLKRFLYGPILRAMDRREERLAASFSEAEATQAEARRIEGQYHGLLEELEEARGVRLHQVEEEADEQRRRLLAAAREEADAVRLAWAEAIRDEREQFFTELKKRVGHTLLRVARKSLGDLSHAELERLMAARFNERLGQLDNIERQQLVQAALEHGVLVRSSFALPEDLRFGLRAEVDRLLAQPVEIRFQEQVAMPLGIELSVGGLKLSWGVDSYFEELEQEVAALYDGQTAPAAGEHS